MRAGGEVASVKALDRVVDVASRDGTATQHDAAKARGGAAVLKPGFVSQAVVLRQQLDARALVAELCRRAVCCYSGPARRWRGQSRSGRDTLASGERSRLTNRYIGQRSDEYKKEHYASSLASQTGVIPIAEVVAIGRAELGGEPIAYALQEMLAGRSGREAFATSPEKRAAICHDVGRILRALRGIQTHGFGESFDAETKRFTQARWAHFIDAKVERAQIDAILVPEGIIERRDVARTMARFDALKDLHFTPILTHGDLHPDNLIVADNGTIAGVIDWGNSASSHPLADLAEALTPGTTRKRTSSLCVRVTAPIGLTANATSRPWPHWACYGRSSQRAIS